MIQLYHTLASHPAYTAAGLVFIVFVLFFIRYYFRPQPVKRQYNCLTVRITPYGGDSDNGGT
jgi:hypothetical protein